MRRAVADMNVSGWREERTRGMWWMVDTREIELETALALGFGTLAGAADLLTPRERVPGDPSGRAQTRVLAIPPRDDSLHVRAVLHGGALAPLWRGRLAGFGRVRKELLLSAELARRGAPVPHAVLGVALRSRGLWRASLATLHVNGGLDGIRFLAAPRTNAETRGAAHAAGRAVRRFHDLGGRHPDLHLGNLLVRHDDAGFRAWVIDLDRARLGAPSGARRRRRELQRLQRSLEKRKLVASLGPSGREAFRKGYGCDGEASACRRSAEEPG